MELPTQSGPWDAIVIVASVSLFTHVLLVLRAA